MDIKDKLIFVTGVVGRAMGSGKFTGADIQALSDLAAQAFENTFGSVAAAPAPAPQQPYAPPAGNMVQMPVPALPEGKPFDVWRKDKCSHWNPSMRDATWEWLLETARKPDGLQAQATLKELAASEVGDDPKWKKANQRRIERAKAVLIMLANKDPF